MICYSVRMKTKLTLSVDKELVHFARTQARSNGRSVSAMFSDFLDARRTQAKRQSIASAADMVGTLKSYSINDSKPGIRAARAKKHLR